MLENFEFVYNEEPLCARKSLKQGLCQEGWIILLQAKLELVTAGGYRGTQLSRCI